MVGWHHQLNGHEFEQAPGVGDGQGGLVCCSPWGRKESDTTERLNYNCVVHSEMNRTQRTGNCSMLCGSLDGRGVWGRMDTCIWMAESLGCPPETIMTLLIGYAPV